MNDQPTNGRELSEGWKIEPLTNIVDVYDKRRIPLSEPERQKRRGNYPYCGANGILDYIDDYLFDGEYVLLAEDGGYWGAFDDSAYLMRGKFWVNNHAHIIQAKPDKANNQFLVNLLNYLNLDPYISGTTRGKLNQGTMKEIPLPLPPLPEQRTITHALRTAQMAHEARRREAALERERKAALMQRLFTQGTRGEPTKATEIGEVPVSWEVDELSRVANIVYGVQAAVAHLKDSSIGIPILTNVNIRNDGVLDLSTLRYYDLPQHKRVSLLLRKGDVLFNWRSGSQEHVGKTTIFDIDGDFTFSSFILRFRTHAGLHNHFLFYYLHWLKSQGFFVQNRQQSSVNSVFNASVAATIPVILPSFVEQCAIVEVLRAFDEKIAALEREAATHDELFKALLEELMTGRRRVS